MLSAPVTCRCLLRHYVIFVSLHVRRVYYPAQTYFLFFSLSAARNILAGDYDDFRCRIFHWRPPQLLPRISPPLIYSAPPRHEKASFISHYAFFIIPSSPCLSTIAAKAFEALCLWVLWFWYCLVTAPLRGFSLFTQNYHASASLLSSLRKVRSDSSRRSSAYSFLPSQRFPAYLSCLPVPMRFLVICFSPASFTPRSPVVTLAITDAIILFILTSPLCSTLDDIWGLALSHGDLSPIYFGDILRDDMLEMRKVTVDTQPYITTIIQIGRFHSYFL